MPGLFLRQLVALLWKNWIVLSKHPFVNLLRCFILPVGFGIFLSVAQRLFNFTNNNGLGTPVPIADLRDKFDGSLALVWADGTNGAAVPSASEIMAHVASGFTQSQRNAVKQVSSPSEIPAACPQNLQDVSECFAAIAFWNLPELGNNTTLVNYTIRADAGLHYINVQTHSSDFEKRILPLQWAIDQAIIELKTGIKIPTPLEWPFTQETNEEQFTNIRLSYIRGIRKMLSIALFIGYIGIAYHLPGAFSGERANLLTSHLKAMGLLDSARIISWHLSISLAYLPAWVIVAITWHYRIFTHTNVVLVLFIHLLIGLSLASWSFFIATPFGKSPQLAAITSTFLSVLFAILALVYSKAGNTGAFIFSLLLPPGFYIFALRAICGFENHLITTSIVGPDPDNQLRLFPLIIAAIIGIFLWPYLAVLLERRLYDARSPTQSSRTFWRKRESHITEDAVPITPDTAISIRNIEKTFSTSIFRRKKGSVTAIADLTLGIPEFGIFVLLGANGAGKSTLLSILGGLLSHTRGSVTFSGGLARPPHGTLGIVPQKNVIFPELTCIQTLRLWSAVKRSSNSLPNEDLQQLLRDCDLENKINHNANTLSGGQKRKLQLAIGLVGGSKIVLIDECTSGVDPLSRRAMWRTLTSLRNERTIVFTTHFLDEADLLADHIVVLATPGKLVAEGSPVSLKSTLGEGYSVQIAFNAATDVEKQNRSPPAELLQSLRTLAPNVSVTSPSPHHASYHLKSKDSSTVEKVLQLLEIQQNHFGIASYEVLGTSIEDIFLRLMTDEVLDNSGEEVHSSSPRDGTLVLTEGRRRSPLNQALTIFHKRALVARRSWLTPLLAVMIAVVGATIPLPLMKGRHDSCITEFLNAPSTSLYLPEYSPFSTGPSFVILTVPPDIALTLGEAGAKLHTSNIADNATFVDTVNQNFRKLSLGGISLDVQTGNSLIAWEATSPGFTGPAMVNFAMNILFNHALNSTGKAGTTPSSIIANYEPFPFFSLQVFLALRWATYFGAAMAVFPAFFALYVSRERRSSVQAMQFSNGLSNPIALWLGHLLFDSVFTVILATLITIIFTTASDQFHGLGLFWAILVLYGIVGALFSYCVSLITPSPLSAFAVAAGYQIVMFMMYLMAYMFTLTFAKNSEAGHIITIIHFVLSLASPVASVSRAAFVSVNLFSLLCHGTTHLTATSLGDLVRYGGPILYLSVTGLILFAILVWVDSGSILPERVSRRRATQSSDGTSKTSDRSPKDDVHLEAKSVSNSDDPLRVLGVTKSFGGIKVVDDVSFGVPSDTIFAMLGPNGAGKTTIFNIIRGDTAPNSGDVLIKDISVIRHPRAARVFLGVCPQFTAIDSQLTVREHLMIYGRLKGLIRGEELDGNIDSLMHATGLYMYADRLASKLSGGNQRKLSLAVAMIGNPAVILIDEFSTGIDAKMKRDMWNTLRIVAAGKSVMITTHSMEEASALANKVCIIAKQILAVGNSETLTARNATYEVHFSCRTREDITRAQQLMARIPGSRMADDVATRFEVPIQGENRLSLAQLFHLLASQGDFPEYTVERATLESVFLKVIRENNVLEEDSPRRTAQRLRFW